MIKSFSIAIVFFGVTIAACSLVSDISLGAEVTKPLYRYEEKSGEKTTILEEISSDTPCLGKTDTPSPQFEELGQKTPLDTRIEELIEKTKRDLSMQINAKTEEISVVDVQIQEIAWQSFECKPESPSQKVVLPAYRFGIFIILQVEEVQYLYLGIGRHIYFCGVTE